MTKKRRNLDKVKKRNPRGKGGCELRIFWVGYCYYCGEEPRPNETYHWDHFIPKCLGGRATKQNLVFSCPTCNRIKGRHLFKHARIALLRKRFGWLARDVDPVRLKDAKLYFEEEDAFHVSAFG